MFTGTNKTVSFEFTGGGEGRGTNIDEVAWLIASLKATIIHSRVKIIKALRVEQAELKAGEVGLDKNTRKSIHSKPNSVLGLIVCIHRSERSASRLIGILNSSSIQNCFNLCKP